MSIIMEEPKIVTYHQLAKIGIKEIFYFYNIHKMWKWNEKMIETIDGREWLYDPENNVYELRELKLESV